MSEKPRSTSMATVFLGLILVVLTFGGGYLKGIGYFGERVGSGGNKAVGQFYEAGGHSFFVDATGTPHIVIDRGIEYGSGQRQRYGMVRLNLTQKPLSSALLTDPDASGGAVIAKISKGEEAIAVTPQGEIYIIKSKPIIGPASGLLRGSFWDATKIN